MFSPGGISWKSNNNISLVSVYCCWGLRNIICIGFDPLWLVARNGLILCKERWNTQTWAVCEREECTVRWWWWLQLLFYQLGIIHLKMNCKLHPGLPCWANLIVWECWERIYPDESGWCLCLFCLWLWTGAKFQANNRQTQVKYYLEVLQHCSSICWILILVSWELLCGMNMNWDHDICE